jgi:hypothetical protein
MLQGLRPSRDIDQSRRRTRFLALMLTAAAHLMLLVALFWPRTAPPPPRAQLLPIQVSLLALPEPPGPPDAPQMGGKQDIVQPVLPHPVAPVFRISDSSDVLSESQLAGAAGAGEGGGGGGGCDTARLVQQALRRDPRVHMAVEDARRLGKASMLWNGDWVRSGEQDGKGLSVVRQAIVWEVAFAPEACRNERVHGLVLLSLQDGATRFAIGSGEWRWSDLLGLRRPPSDR